MTRNIRISIVVAAVLAVAVALSGSTINGIANQIISGLAAHGVVIGGGTGDLTVATPSATVGYPLLSAGSSADPAFGQVPNAGLANSSITFAAAGCITASGATALGGTLTLTNTCQPMAVVSNANATGAVTWVVANGDAFYTLTGNVTLTVTVAAGDVGRKVNIQACQDAGGAHTLGWPANVKGAITIGATASKCSTQSFESFDGTNLYAVNTGVINQ